MKVDFQVNQAELANVIKQVREVGEQAKRDLENEINKSAIKIESDAKRNAPVDDGRLRSSISTSPFGDYGREVEVAARYAPYVEFGTKSKVQIPQGLESYAMQFKSSGGNFDDLLKSIEVWAKKKGLPEEAAYPIAVKIARDGVRAQPFLFPAYNAEKLKLIKRLKKKLNGR